MCVLCEIGLDSKIAHSDLISANGLDNVSNTGDQNIDAILIGSSWDSTSLTYTFPTSGDYFTDDPYEIRPGEFDQGFVDDFVAFTSSMATAMRNVLDMFSDVSGLKLTEVTPSTASPADLVFAQTNDTSLSTASGRFPNYTVNEGHQWYRDSNYSDTPERGTYTWHTLIHETGHTMGLAHGHSADSISATYTGATLTADRDSMEFSIMTYNTYVGDATPSYSTNEEYGYAQTLMMYDIAALQELYGANYTENAGDNTYTWSETSGEMFIDGVGQGAAGANRIFMTLWDGDGEDTFDLANYDSGVSVDLSPGGWSAFDDAQLSDLGEGVFSRGNVFNALLHNDNSQSLIENIIAGDGNDILVGNRVGNDVQGNIGNDTLVGAGGADTLYGGADNDLLYGDALNVFESGVGFSGTGTILVGNTHDTMSTALDVTNLFVQSPYVNIENSANNPHATIRYSSASAGPQQWYAVTVNADTNLIFDIDATSNLDAFIILYDNTGTQITFSDDSVVDTGSSSFQDSFLSYEVDTTGTYFIEVGNFLSATTSTDLSANAQFDLNITAITPTATGSDGAAGADVLYGGEGADTLFGGEGQDTLHGDQDADILSGGKGADQLYGGEDNDDLTGDGGADTIEGGKGADTLYGNEKNDVLIGGKGDDLIFGGLDDDDLTGGGGSDTLDGGDGNDTLDGGDDRDILTGGKGEDSLSGGGDADNLLGEKGADSLFGDDGKDTIDGGKGADVLEGGNSNDVLVGGGGDDTIRGGKGDDTLSSGEGIDILKGASGRDVFEFLSASDSANNSSADRILDFDVGDDLISLVGVDNSLTFVGGAAFSGTDNEVRFTNNGTDTIIRVDLDGDGSSDMRIALDDYTGGLSASDFIL